MSHGFVLLIMCRREEENCYLYFVGHYSISNLRSFVPCFIVHTSYRGAVKENLFTGDHVSRETFMLMLADIWGDWASQETVRKAFKTCGVTTDGLDVEL
jgi:hypothetical protein